MDAQEISNSEALPEVHIQVGSEGTATDKTSEESQRPTLIEVFQGASSEGTSTDKAPQAKTVNVYYRRLFEAALGSNWKVAEKFLKEHDEAMTADVLTVAGESRTILQVAVMTAQDQFVENLVSSWRQGCDIRILRKALKSAAMRGRLRMVKALVDIIREEVGEVDASEDVSHALSKAISHAPIRREVIGYLASCTISVPDHPTMRNLIMAGHLVLYLSRKYEGSMPFTINNKIRLLKDLAKLESYFLSGTRFTFLQRCIYKCIPLWLFDASVDNPRDTMAAAPFIKRIGELKLRHKYSYEFLKLALSDDVVTPEILKLTSEVVLEAASHGISEIVELCLKKFPELMWDAEFAQKLLQEVVSGRHVALFRLATAHLGDSNWTEMQLINNVIEWTPRCVSSNVSGAAFLLQSELQWYTVVEGRTQPSMKSSKSSGRLIDPLEKKRYWEDFIEQRRDLHKEAREWMKDTSSSCSLVVTLIITVAFAAAFTVPGGNDGSTGIPIFSKDGSFIVFVIADALALFSSVTAILMFLSILTSHYAVEDFHYALPSKMILGLTFQFFSLVFMLVAFISALKMILNEQPRWTDYPIWFLAAFPIVLFTMLHLFDYVQIVESTIRPSLYRTKKFWK